MRGRKPNEYKLEASDRRYLNEIASQDQRILRIANRARALLALDRGERISEIVRWLGLQRFHLSVKPLPTGRGTDFFATQQQSARSVPRVVASGLFIQQQPAVINMPDTVLVLMA